MQNSQLIVLWWILLFSTSLSLSSHAQISGPGQSILKNQHSSTNSYVFSKSQVIKDYQKFLETNKSWVEQLKKRNEHQQKELLDKYKNDRNWFEKIEGGVTDGGGNKVGPELYDYWVSKGTVEVSVENLMNWNDNLIEQLNYLRSLSPTSTDLNYQGWVDEIEEVAQKQKWLLDAKPINNVNCWNLSPNVTSLQEVVGCNTEHEVRIYAPHFLGTDEFPETMIDKFQSGFIMHELLLSWAKARFGFKMTKYNIELGVQKVNQAIRSRSNVIETLRIHFMNSHILTNQEIALLVQIRAHVLFAGSHLCELRPLPSIEYLNNVGSNPKARRFLNKSLMPLMSAVHAIGTEDEVLYRNIFCYENNFYKVRHLDQLSLQCKQVIQKFVNSEVDSYYAGGDWLFEQEYQDTNSHKAAQSCFDLVKMGSPETKAQIYIQSLEYFKRSFERFTAKSQSPFLFTKPKGW